MAWAATKCDGILGWSLELHRPGGPSRESHENQAQCGTFSDNDRCDLLSSGFYRSERDCGPYPNDRDWNSGTFASGTGAIPAPAPSPNPSTSLTLAQGPENPVSPIPVASPGTTADHALGLVEVFGL